jgi:preprotein translocase subunit SecD
VRRSLVWSLVGFVVAAVVSLGVTLAVGNSPLLGLDLKGGVSVVLQPQHTVDSTTLQQAVNIIEQRVNSLGVADADVQRQGRDVVISLPGIKDSQSALKTVGTTAQLYFRPVVCQIPDYVAPSSTSSTTTPAAGATSPTTATSPAKATTPTTAKASIGVPRSPVLDAFSAASTATTTPATTTPATTTPATTTPATTTPTTTAPATVPVNGPVTESDCTAANVANIKSTAPGSDNPNKLVIVPASKTSGYTSSRFILGKADFSGKAVKSASVGVDSTSGVISVNLTFTSAGSKEFNKMAAVRSKYYSSTATSPSILSLEAIELDGVLESAPQIEQANFNGTAQITGSFTESQASALATELKYGSLPVRFTPQSVETVSATIGAASLRAGLLAGLGGIVVVLLYMILYYRALGFVVLVGLSLGGAILYSVLTELSQTASLALTLSGVIGIIVSIGITVDSYVVYFERLKDEVRSGRTVRQSVERSFARAFRTVLTADAVSFLAALILYLLTVGDVRGFAFTLGLSTLLDVFTAYFFIRPAVILVGRRRTFTDAPILGIARGLGASSGSSS